MPEETTVKLEPTKAPMTLRDPDEAAAATPGASEDWEVESESAETSLAPDDTTEAAIRAEAEAQAKAGDTPVPDAASADASEGDESSDQESASAEASSPEEPATEAEPAKETKAQRAKRKRTARRDALQEEINRLTWERNQELQRIQEARAQRASLTETRQQPPADEERDGASQQSSPPPEAPFPTLPVYTDFDTDDAYRAAVQEYNGKVASWHAEQTKRVREDVAREMSTGVSQQLEAERARQAHETAREQFVAARERAQAEHDDWHDVVENVKQLRSSWTNEKFTGQDGQIVPTPFLSDVVANTEQGPELLYWLGSNLDEAHALAELQPTTALRHAIVRSPSPDRLMQHFATEAGRAEFERLKALHPVDLSIAIGVLSAQVSAAPRGSTEPAPEPITQASPPAKPPRGMPAAQTHGQSQNSNQFDFESWMRAEDEREQKERERLLGARP